MDKSFAVLPPHFDADTLRSISNEDWQILLPGYISYPETFLQCLPFLVASVIFHEEFLRSSLRASRPIFSSQLFAGGYASKLRGKALTGISVCPQTGLRASGIPSHLVLAGQVAELQDEVLRLRQEMEAGRLQDRAALLAKLDSLPQELLDKLVRNIAINGTNPVTRDDITGLTNDMVARIVGLLEARFSSVSSQSTSPPDVAASTDESVRPFKTWRWGGRMHMVPEGWVLPRCTPKSFFLLWNFGLCDQCIQPLKHLTRFDVSDADWIEVSRARGVLRELERIRTHLDPTSLPMGQLTKQDFLHIFDDAYTALTVELYGAEASDSGIAGRNGDRAISTVYNRLQKNRKTMEE